MIRTKLIHPNLHREESKREQNGSPNGVLMEKGVPMRLRIIGLIGLTAFKP